MLMDFNQFGAIKLEDAFVVTSNEWELCQHFNIGPTCDGAILDEIVFFRFFEYSLPCGRALQKSTCLGESRE